MSCPSSSIYEIEIHFCDKFLSDTIFSLCHANLPADPLTLLTMVEVVLERGQHIIGFSPEAQVDLASFLRQAGILLSYPFFCRWALVRWCFFAKRFVKLLSISLLRTGWLYEELRIVWLKENMGWLKRQITSLAPNLLNAYCIFLAYNESIKLGRHISNEQLTFKPLAWRLSQSYLRLLHSLLSGLGEKIFRLN